MSDATAQLVPFQYENERVRVLEIDGEPWFVLTDLCAVLGIGSPHKVAERIDGDARNLAPVIDSRGRTQQATIVSEAGMYEVVIRSDKPEAARFRRWITAEVLPTIRRTGSYGTAMALPDRRALAQMVIEAEDARMLAEAKVAELAPKAELADNYLTASAGSRLVGEAAKIFGMKEKELRAFLLAERLIFIRHAACGNVQYDHYAEFAPHFEARETVVNHTWGSCNHYTLRITPRGIDLIRKRIRRQEDAA